MSSIDAKWRATLDPGERHRFVVKTRPVVTLDGLQLTWALRAVVAVSKLVTAPIEDSGHDLSGRLWVVCEGCVEDIDAAALLEWVSLVAAPVEVGP